MIVTLARGEVVLKLGQHELRYLLLVLKKFRA